LEKWLNFSSVRITGYQEVREIIILRILGLVIKS
jgi:hypothetical protein